MSTRLRLSEKTSDRLNILTNKLGLRRNIICRIAIGRSLAEKNSVKNMKPEDSSGTELNRYTITGEQDELYRALINQHEKKRLNDFEYFSKFLRNHIERGVNLLLEEYNKINSPIDFLVSLFDEKERRTAQVDLFKN